MIVCKLVIFYQTSSFNFFINAFFIKNRLFHSKRNIKFLLLILNINLQIIY